MINGTTSILKIINFPNMCESSYLLQAFEETPTHMSIKINQLEEGHNSYPLVCQRPTETGSLQRYTTLPHDKLKTRLKETIHKGFSHINYGSKFVVLGYNSTYFSNKIQKGKTCYSNIPVCEIKGSSLMNLLIFGKLLKKLRLI
jgi:hypothetical protein